MTTFNSVHKEARDYLRKLRSMITVSWFIILMTGMSTVVLVGRDADAWMPATISFCWGFSVCMVIDLYRQKRSLEKRMLSWGLNPKAE